MKNFLAFAILAVTASVAIAQGPVPTCDPSDPSCTLDNGCNGGPCHFTLAAKHAPAHRHGKKAVKR
jgi:hypothetical protein